MNFLISLKDECQEVVLGLQKGLEFLRKVEISLVGIYSHGILISFLRKEGAFWRLSIRQNQYH